jgi:hypothetical protein
MEEQMKPPSMSDIMKQKNEVASAMDEKSKDAQGKSADSHKSKDEEIARYRGALERVYSYLKTGVHTPDDCANYVNAALQGLPDETQPTEKQAEEMKAADVRPKE